MTYQEFINKCIVTFTDEESVELLVKDFLLERSLLDYDSWSEKDLKEWVQDAVTNGYAPFDAKDYYESTIEQYPEDADELFADFADWLKEENEALAS